MMEDILTALSDLDAFSKRQKKVAEYISANYDTAAFMTAEHLAKAANVSESTVVRFASELGFDSFSGLRRALQDVLRGRIDSRSMGIKSGKISALQREMIKTEEYVKTAFDAAASGFEKLCFYMRCAARVCVCGQGRSYALAQYMAASLCELRSGVTVLHTSDAEEAVRRLGQEDLLVDISLCGGNTAHISAAAETGAHVALIMAGERDATVRADDLLLRADNAAAVIMIIDAVCLENSDN